jgi:hypothetical protein
MVKIRMDPAFTMLLPEAEIYDPNVIRFIFTCKALSDGSQKTLSVCCKITASGEVSVCDYEVGGGPLPGLDQDAAMLFPDDSGMDDDTDEACYLADFGSRTH